MRAKSKKAASHEPNPTSKIESRFKLPVFDSIAQCSSATGIPLAVLRFAKRNGCPAFDYSRVKLSEFLEWHFKRTDGDQNWDDKFKEFRAKREQQKFSREDGRTISTDDAEAAGSIAIGALNRVLRQALCNDLPAATKGLDEIGIRTANEAALERAFEESRKAFAEEIEKSKRTNEDETVAA